MGRQQCIVLVFELHVAVKNIKILSATEKCFYVANNSNTYLGLCVKWSDMSV